jgi:hypothetical protein
LQVVGCSPMRFGLFTRLCSVFNFKVFVFSGGFPVTVRLPLELKYSLITLLHLCSSADQNVVGHKPPCNGALCDFAAVCFDVKNSLWLSHPTLQGKPNASHVCARMILHTHDRQNECNTVAVINRS